MIASVSQPAQQLILATALGLLVGLERLRAGKEAGIRTFSLTAMAGCLSQMAGQPWLAGVALALTGVTIWVTNSSALGKGSGAELTTSAALVVVSFAGILTGLGQVFVPVASVIIVLVLLAWKDEMVHLSTLLTREEVHAAIMLLLLGLVVLPVLPAGTVDPWHLVNLRTAWITVVLISGIGFVNYVLLRLFGARGITYAALLGGLVNSTATVADMTNYIRKGGEPFTQLAFRGIMLATLAMLLRNGLILALLAPGALLAGVIPVGLMLVVITVIAFRGMRTAVAAPLELSVRSPFSLGAALAFGAYFLTLTIIAGVAQPLFGNLGFYAVNAVGGLVSSSSASASAATLARQGAISNSVAGFGVVLASLASALGHLPLVLRVAAGTQLGRAVYRATALMLVAAVAGLAVSRLLV